MNEEIENITLTSEQMENLVIEIPKVICPIHGETEYYLSFKIDQEITHFCSHCIKKLLLEKIGEVKIK